MIAAPFVYLLKEAGFRRQAAARRYLVVRRAWIFAWTKGDRHPFQRTGCGSRTRLIFPGTFIGRQTISRSLHRQTFTEEIAPARTFCFLQRSRPCDLAGWLWGAVWTTPSWLDEDGP